jgi:hypothetical protein
MRYVANPDFRQSTNHLSHEKIQKIGTTQNSKDDHVSQDQEHSSPSPTAPYAVAVAVEVDVDQPVQASSLRTKTHHERTSARSTYTTNNRNNNNNQAVTNVEIELQANADPEIVFGGDPLRGLHLTQPIPSLRTLRATTFIRYGYQV